MESWTRLFFSIANLPQIVDNSLARGPAAPDLVGEDTVATYVGADFSLRGAS